MEKYLTMNDGNRIPTLGLGTWKSDKGLVGDAVEFALTKAGYRHVDCAAIYGNEKEIGTAFKSVFQGKLKREDVFITSKLWNTEHRPDNVEKALRKTLADLQLEYLDLYLIHWGVAFRPGGESEPIGKDGIAVTEPVPIMETWRAMEKLVGKGLVKSIGVANFTAPMLTDLHSYAKIKPVTNQIELHPYNAQTALFEYCNKIGITVTAYSPLGRQGVATISKPKLFAEPLIIELAGKYGKTPSQILLNWGVARGTVVIPKSVTPERIRENAAIYGFSMSPGDMAAITGLDRGHRFVNPAEWWGIPYFA